MDDVADPVGAGERHLGDLGNVQALRGQQHHLGPSPGHHRPGAPADDPQQPLPLIVIDLSHPASFSHVIILTVRRHRVQQPDDPSEEGEPCLMRY
ncbi:hypothetical protein QFZ49_006368 [Streptomyces turgidiscabies]|uniref:Uncharacterized protein n=1 Tax=Streptomyces turgidiscabies TaxID=85558 RepID=A0ABU0RX23_9ACTN|nr:hypothetical protein [Streptomyces turgidiscabies]